MQLNIKYLYYIKKTLRKSNEYTGQIIYSYLYLSSSNSSYSIISPFSIKFEKVYFFLNNIK